MSRLTPIQTLAVLALLWAQQNPAKLQIIHAVADVVGVNNPFVIDSVDLYIGAVNSPGDTTWIAAAMNFKFRQATRYLDIPPNKPLVVRVLPGDQSDNIESTPLFRTFPVTSLRPNGLSPNVAYVLIISGQVNQAAPPPLFGLRTEFYEGARLTSTDSNQFQFIVFHGANNVGTVDVYLGYDRTTSAYQPDLTLSQYAYHPTYLSLSSDNLVVLDTTPANKNDFLPVGFYAPDPNPNLVGQTGVVFASGYANTNEPRKAFGLHVALANGTVLSLPVRDVRRLQIVHNAADPVLAEVDIYVGGPDNRIQLDFRKAIPTIFVDAETGANVPLVVTRRNAPSDTLARLMVTIPPGGTNYVIFAQGVRDTNRFAANPNGIQRHFRLQVIPNFEGWAPSNQFKAVPFHGVTDAPAVDLVAGGAPIAQNLRYLDFASPVSLSSGTAVTIEVRPAGQQSAVASFQLSATQTRSGQGAVIFASGFLNPAQNQNGPAFGLYIVYPDGTVEPLGSPTAISTAQAVSFAHVGSNPSLTGEWTLYIGASQSATLPLTLMTLSGQVLRQEVYTIPGAGTWGYNLSFPELSPGIYLLRVGEMTLRLVRL